MGAGQGPPLHFKCQDSTGKSGSFRVKIQVVSWIVAKKHFRSYDVQFRMVTINELIKIRLKVTFWHSSCPDLRPLKDDSVILFKSFSSSLYLILVVYIYVVGNDFKIVKLPDNWAWLRGERESPSVI